MAYFIMVAAGVFLSTMDSSMINVALPYIMSNFSTTLAKVEWVVLMYLLTISVSLLIWGKLSDRLGKGIVYLIGILIFTVGAMCCYFSPSINLLIGSRFIQGFGAAMMMSTGPAIIRLAVPRDSIGKWLGSLGIATSMGLMSGPLLGGFILHNYSWRTIFLINVPISFSVFLFGWIFLAGTLPKYIDENFSFDWKGAILWIAMVGLVVVLLNGNLVNGSGLRILASALLMLVTIAIFYHESRQRDPLIPVSLLSQRFFGIAMITATLSFTVLFFVLILMPFFLRYILDLSFDKIGCTMIAVPVSLFVVSPAAGRLFDRFGAKYLTTIGMLVTGIAILLISTLSMNSSLLDIAWRLSLLGCGQSIFLSPNTASVLSKVTFQQTGITAGMLATCRNIGMLIGVALVGLIFGFLFSYFSDGMNLKNYTVQELPYFLKAFRLTLIPAAFISFGAALISYQRE